MTKRGAGLCLPVLLILSGLLAGCSGGGSADGFRPILQATSGQERYEEIKRYGRKKMYLLQRLREIRDEVLAEVGEGWRATILAAFDESIANAAARNDEFSVKALQQSREKIVQFSEGEWIEFYKTDEYKHNTIHEFPMGDVTFAQGQRWARVAPGLYSCLVDPQLQKYSMVHSVKIPRLADNVMTIRLPVKFGDRGYGWENSPCNLVVYEHAVQFVYKFFEGEISREEFDAAAEEVVVMGYNDRTINQIYQELDDESLTNAEKRTIYTRAALVRENPKAQIKREFNGKVYTFKYDNHDGYLIIEFTLDHQEIPE